MVRGRLVLFVILAVSLVFGLLFARQAYLSRDLPREVFEEKTLRLLTYSTFVGANGPGAQLIQRFQKECGCKVKVVSAGDAGLLLERLQVAEEGEPFDVVLGLDQLMVPDARSRFQWKELFFGTANRHPVLADFADPYLVPYDWSPLTFVFRKGDFTPPRKFDDLLKPEFRKAFALQDPHSSTPGRQFLHWVQALKGERTIEFLRQFEPNVNSISPSWVYSYGLFQKEQTRFVFSYLTSLAFHWGVEKKRDYQVVVLEEGHPVQVEYVGIPASCRECEMAEKFVESLLKPEAQKLIMEKNFMFPVIKDLEQGSVFGELPRLKTIRTPAEKAFREWDEVFKR